MKKGVGDVVEAEGSRRMGPLWAKLKGALQGAKLSLSAQTYGRAQKKSDESKLVWQMWVSKKKGRRHGVANVVDCGI